MKKIKFRYRILDDSTGKIIMVIYTLKDIEQKGFCLLGTILSRDLFTGLKDKNGKEIYEGDIVKCVCDIQEINEKLKPLKLYGVIKWDENKSKFYVDFLRKKGFCSSCESFNYDWRTMIIVIGNIYENPELLKEVEEWKKQSF